MQADFRRKDQLERGGHFGTPHLHSTSGCALLQMSKRSIMSKLPQISASFSIEYASARLEHGDPPSRAERYRSRAASANTCMVGFP